MKLIIDLIVGLLWVLIKIGDFVLFAGETVGKNIKKFLKNLKKTKIRFPQFKLSFPKNKKRVKVKKQPKLVSIFPGPIPQFIKFKYFILGAVFSFLLIYLPLLFLIFLQNLPNPRVLALRDISQTTKIYDRHGTLLYQIYANQNRTLVPLSSIPQDLINATIAIEDKDFYKNPGFDVAAIVRATIGNLQGKPLQGGSTITQQLIKSTLLTPEQTFERKIKEIILAFWAERIFTKDQILTMYFNQVSYGGTAWGVEAAAETYFGKDVKDLDLAQSTFLAGLTKAPTTYYPYGDNPELWKERQKEVLSSMKNLGFINSDELAQASSENLTFLPPQSPIYAPHFVFYVKDYLVKKYGLEMVEKGGLNVVTSLDLPLQQKTENIVRTEVSNDSPYNLTNGAALVTNPKNGDVLAMVGSKDYDDPNFGKVNLTTSLRQPGSSIKVVTYSAALEKGFTAATILNDSPVTFGNPGSSTYTPVNYDGKFHGNVSLRVALGNSINIPAVRTLNTIGLSAMIDKAKEMGITTWNNPQSYGLAITLGAAEVKMTDMAIVYGTLANGGERVNLNPILKISDSQGKTIFEKKDLDKTKVLDSGIAYIISNILADNGARTLEFGPNSPLYIPGYDVSVKTGTSDRFRDNWTIGYAPNFVAAVWVGNNDGTPMNGIASGITGAAPIWHDIALELLGKGNVAKMQRPDDVVEKPCIGRKELFIKGTENSVNCNLVDQSATISAQQVKSQ